VLGERRMEAISSNTGAATIGGARSAATEASVFALGPLQGVRKLGRRAK